MGRMREIIHGLFQFDIAAFSISERAKVPANRGKAHRAQLRAGKKPATVHIETRQQRRAAARKAKEPKP